MAKLTQSAASFAVLAGVCGSVVFGLAGCRSDPTQPPGLAVSDPLPGGDYPNIALDTSLDRFIAVDAPIVTRGEDAGMTPTRDALLHVTTPVRALTGGRDIRVQWRYSWFDGLGRRVGEPGDWRYTKLSGNQREELEGNAMDSRATNWRLEIRPAE